MSPKLNVKVQLYIEHANWINADQYVNNQTTENISIVVVCDVKWITLILLSRLFFFLNIYQGQITHSGLFSLGSTPNLGEWKLWIEIREEKKTSCN